MANFAQIVDVIAPQNALPGELVEVTVVVKNLYSVGGITVGVTGTYNYIATPFVPATAAIPSQQIKAFKTSFTMPDESARVVYGAWYKGADQEFYLDDQGSTNIALGAEVPPNGNGEPPDDEKSWFEKNQGLVITGVAGLAFLGVILVRR